MKRPHKKKMDASGQGDKPNFSLSLSLRDQVWEGRGHTEKYAAQESMLRCVPHSAQEQHAAQESTLRCVPRSAACHTEKQSLLGGQHGRPLLLLHQWI